MASVEDDEYEIPLRDQRYFGAGVKRKRLHFVPATSASTQPTSSPSKSALSAADRYLSIVLKKPIHVDQPAVTPTEDKEIPTNHTRGDEQAHPDSVATAHGDDVSLPSRVVCDICNKAVLDSDAISRHESSITHQICLQHSHPPSHLDRSRKGLAVLESQGWDPDSRLGLGAGGEGRLYPVRAKENPTRAGLGVKFDLKARKVEKPVKLDAGKVRSMEREGKKKAEKLRNAFYRSEDVERYLGGGQ